MMIKMAHKYFTYDRDQNEFETHESKEEAFSNEQLSGVNYSDKFKE